MEWFDVKTAFPPPDGRMVVLACRAKDGRYHYRLLKTSSKFGKFEPMVSAVSEHGCTHWINLPPLPEVDSNKKGKA